MNVNLGLEQAPWVSTTKPILAWIVGLCAATLGGNACLRHVLNLPAGVRAWYAPVLGLLLFGWLAFWGGSGGLDYFRQDSLQLLLATLALCGLVDAVWNRRQKAPWGEILAVSVVFAALFAFFLLQRLGSPNIMDLYRDEVGGECYGPQMMNAIYRVARFPLYDPFLAGENLHYYYFGYVVFGGLGKAMGVPPMLALQLGMATVMALAGTATAGFLRQLGAGKEGMASGVVFTCLAVTPLSMPWVLERILAWINHAKPPSVWGLFALHGHAFFSTGTNFLTKEFHPHLIDTPFLLLAFGVLEHAGTSLANALRRRSWNQEVLMAAFAAAFLVGVNYASNSWSSPFLLGSLGLGLLARDFSGRRETWKVQPWRTALEGTLVLGIVTGVSVLLMLPFFVDAGSSWRPALINSLTGSKPLWMVMLYFWPIALLLLPDFRKLPRRVKGLLLLLLLLAAPFPLSVFAFLAMAGALTWHHLKGSWESAHEAAAARWAFWGALCIAGAEIFFIMDRATTQFKMQHFAGLALLPVIALPLKGGRLWLRRGVLGILFVGYLVAVVFRSFPGGFPPLSVERLDGLAYLKNLPTETPAGILGYSPHEWERVAWMNEHIHSIDVILQAAGGRSYQGYSAPTNFTGLPTVLGWAWHAQNLSGPRGWMVVEPRMKDVDRLYSSDDVTEIVALLKKWRIRWIVIGQAEEERYGKRDFAALRSQGRQVWSAGRESLYAVGP